jgi:hypothetical protein
MGRRTGLNVEERRKISPPQNHPSAVQPVASRYYRSLNLDSTVWKFDYVFVTSFRACMFVSKKCK